MEKAEKNLHTAVLSVPLPICIINEQGKIIGASDQISQVFLYDDILDGDLFALTGVKVAELYQSLQDGICPIIKRNDRVFKLAAQKSEEDEHSLLVFFYDSRARITPSSPGSLSLPSLSVLCALSIGCTDDT